MADDCSSARRLLLFESLGISVVDFCCHAHVQPLGREELNPTHSIVFIRRGAFGRSQNGETLIADPNHVLFFNAAAPYRYSHPIPGGDDCTILTVESAQALDLVGRHAAEDLCAEAPFQSTHALSSPRAVRLHWELLSMLEKPVPELMLQDAIAELADEAVGCAYRFSATKCSGARSPHAARRHRELSEAVKLTLSKRLHTPPSLAKLADNFGCSPFHLSRTFHDTLGLSLREYVKRLRARVAAERIVAGACDLTELALELGYADHSHFTNSFRDEWGIPPSHFRRSGRLRSGL